MSKEEEKQSFEQSMQRLDEVVNQLESGQVPLEQAIELFAEGMKLAEHCQKKLDWAEQKIEVLVQENGKWKGQSFSEQEE